MLMRLISLHALGNSSFHLHPFSFIHFLSLSHIFYILLQTCQCAHMLIDLKWLHGSLPPLVNAALLTSSPTFYLLAYISVAFVLTCCLTPTSPLSLLTIFAFNTFLFIDVHFSKNCESDIIHEKGTAHCLITVRKWNESRRSCCVNVASVTLDTGGGQLEAEQRNAQKWGWHDDCVRHKLPVIFVILSKKSMKMLTG